MKTPSTVLLMASSLAMLVLHGGQGSLAQQAAILQEAKLLPLQKKSTTSELEWCKVLKRKPAA